MCADAFVAVVEESKLGAFLPALAAAESPTGSSMGAVPSAVIALPADDAGAPFSTAPVRPYREFYATQPPAWNEGGLDLLSLTLPCAVFLALREQTYELRSKAQTNLAQVRSTLMQLKVLVRRWGARVRRNVAGSTRGRDCRTL